MNSEQWLALIEKRKRELRAKEMRAEDWRNVANVSTYCMYGSLALLVGVLAYESNRKTTAHTS